MNQLIINGVTYRAVEEKKEEVRKPRMFNPYCDDVDRLRGLDCMFIELLPDHVMISREQIYSAWNKNVWVYSDAGTYANSDNKAYVNFCKQLGFKEAT